MRRGRWCSIASPSVQNLSLCCPSLPPSRLTRPSQLAEAGDRSILVCSLADSTPPQSARSTGAGWAPRRRRVRTFGRGSSSTARRPLAATSGVSDGHFPSTPAGVSVLHRRRAPWKVRSLPPPPQQVTIPPLSHPLPCLRPTLSLIGRCDRISTVAGAYSRRSWSYAMLPAARDTASSMHLLSLAALRLCVTP